MVTTPEQRKNYLDAYPIIKDQLWTESDTLHKDRKNVIKTI